MHRVDEVNPWYPNVDTCKYEYHAKNNTLCKTITTISTPKQGHPVVTEKKVASIVLFILTIVAIIGFAVAAIIFRPNYLVWFLVAPVLLFTLLKAYWMFPKQHSYGWVSNQIVFDTPQQAEQALQTVEANNTVDDKNRVFAWYMANNQTR